MSASTRTAPVAAAPAAGTYRTRPAFQAAFGAASGLKAGQPAYAAALQVITHLAWKAPTSTVAWHKGTNANMVANAAVMGITPGQPVEAAMAAALKALSSVAGTAALKAAANALVKAAA